MPILVETKARKHVLEAFRQWVGDVKEKLGENPQLGEEYADSLIIFLQGCQLMAEDLPELYTGIAKEGEQVAVGRFYSPPSEIEFLIRKCLFYQLSQSFPQIPATSFESLCFQDNEEAVHDIFRGFEQEIVNFLIKKITVIDPSCGTGNFLVQYVHLIIRWIPLIKPTKNPAIDLMPLLFRCLGVDSDPIAVTITRVRLSSYFKQYFGWKETGTWDKYITSVLSATIAWGNAFGIEGSEELVLCAKNWVKKAGHQSEYLELQSYATKIFQDQDSLNGIQYDPRGISQHLKNCYKFLQKVAKTAGGGNCSSTPLFLWDVNFAHVMQGGGFQVIIGNPPYIRQEDIGGSANVEDEPWRFRKVTQEGRRENRKYKEELLEKLSALANLPEAALTSKADLSAYFFILAKYLSCPGGVCGYITSNAWLDVQYGFELQEFFLKSTRLRGLYEKRFSRAFTTAGINTIISIFEPNPVKSPSEDSQWIESASIGTDYYQSAKSIEKNAFMLQKEYRYRDITLKTSTLPNKGSFRQILASDLLALGSSPDRKTYEGYKWGSLLFRAPDFFFELYKSIRNRFIPFLDVIELRFGMKTGKNAFFIVPNKNVEVTRVENWVYLHALGIKEIQLPADIFIPVITSSRLLRTYEILADAESKYLFRVTGDPAPITKQYIKWGEKRKYHLAPSCQAHAPKWYHLPIQQPPDFVFFRFMDQRMWVPVNQAHLLFSDNFFVGYAKDPSCVKILSAYLNSTFNFFFSEIWGRTNLGEGLLTFYGPDYRFIESLDPHKVPKKQAEELDRLFQALAKQPVRPISEELKNPARINLDTYIAETLLQLPPDVVPRLYEAFQSLVTQRIGRAKGKY